MVETGFNSSAFNGQCEEQAGKFTFSGHSPLHFGVVDRWPITPKRARCSALIGVS